MLAGGQVGFGQEGDRPPRQDERRVGSPSGHLRLWLECLLRGAPSGRFWPQPTKELCMRLTSKMPQASLGGGGRFPRPNGLQDTFHGDHTPSELKRGTGRGPHGPPEGSALTRGTFMSLSFPARTEPGMSSETIPTVTVQGRCSRCWQPAQGNRGPVKRCRLLLRAPRPSRSLVSVPYTAEGVCHLAFASPTK